MGTHHADGDFLTPRRLNFVTRSIEMIQFGTTQANRNKKRIMYFGRFFFFAHTFMRSSKSFCSDLKVSENTFDISRKLRS